MADSFDDKLAWVDMCDLLELEVHGPTFWLLMFPLMSRAYYDGFPLSVICSFSLVTLKKIFFSAFNVLTIVIYSLHLVF